MPNYLRNYVFGGCYFFTIVTYRRICFFQSDKHKQLVLSRFRQAEAEKPFTLLAYCILLDHIHLLMQLPEEVCNYSYQIREIKRLVTVDLQKELGQHPLQVWQNRFWEHTIQDEKDLERHLDYIHYNPVKHGYIEDAIAWKWSSYPEILSSGVLPTKRKLDGAEESANFFFDE